MPGPVTEPRGLRGSVAGRWHHDTTVTVAVVAAMRPRQWHPGPRRARRAAAGAAGAAHPADATVNSTQSSNRRLPRPGTQSWLVTAEDRDATDALEF